MSTDIQLCGEDHGDVVAAWRRHTPDAPFDVLSSMPIQTDTQRLLLLSIVDSDCIKARDKIGEVIEIGHYICHPAELREREDGQLDEGVRTLLIQTQGPPIAFVAKSIITSMQRLGWALGKTPPFIPPERVRLRARGTGGKNYVYYLQRLKDGE